MLTSQSIQTNSSAFYCAALSAAAARQQRNRWQRAKFRRLRRRTRISIHLKFQALILKRRLGERAGIEDVTNRCWVDSRTRRRKQYRKFAMRWRLEIFRQQN